jgi:hypothetical protein
VELLDEYSRGIRFMSYPGNWLFWLVFMSSISVRHVTGVSINSNIVIPISYLPTIYEHIAIPLNI